MNTTQTHTHTLSPQNEKNETNNKESNVHCAHCKSPNQRSDACAFIHIYVCVRMYIR